MRATLAAAKGFSLHSTGSRACGPSSCGSWACLPRGVWNLPGPGIEPVSPAFAGGFSNVEPPGKSSSSLFVPYLVTLAGDFTSEPWFL